MHNLNTLGIKFNSMDCVYKEKIRKTVSDVRAVSFDEKKSPLNSEERINVLLDSIIEFQSLLEKKTVRINDINQKLEDVTWFNNLDEECLKLVNDIISLGKDLHSSLARQYAKMGKLRNEGIAKKEIKALKWAMNDLKENVEDLDSIFFYLPNDPSFVETTKLFALL